MLRSLLVVTLLLPSLAHAQGALSLAPGAGVHVARLGAFHDTTTLQLLREGAPPAPGPRQYESVVAGEWQGRPAFVHRIAVESPRVTMHDTTWYDAKTLAPLAHRSHGPRTITLDYAGAAVRGEIRAPDGTARPVAMTMAPAAFDPSQLHALFRVVPWRAGLAVEFPMLSHETLAVTTRRAAVEGEEALETAGGPVAAWRVAMTDDGRTTRYWLRKDDGAVLKVEAEMRPGMLMRGLAAGVR